MKRITSEVDPDLAEVKRFIREGIAQSAFAILIASILALLASMRDLNTELRRRLEASRRKRPPSETLRRLQMELPFWGAKPGNDVEDTERNASATPERKAPAKRGPKTPDPHGRPKLLAHLERVPDDRRVPQSQCMCPNCHVEAAHVTFKECEKLELQPARFVVVKQRTEVVACQRCHEYVVNAPRPDEIVDRGVLGDELIVQAVVDHHADGVPWKRMERNGARRVCRSRRTRLRRRAAERSTCWIRSWSTSPIER